MEPDLEAEYRVLLKIKEKLQEGNRNFGSFRKRFAVRHYNFLTLKPMIYVCNVSEEELAETGMLRRSGAMRKLREAGSSSFPENRIRAGGVGRGIPELFLGELGLAESGLDKLTKAAYDLLGLATFFTHNEKEVRAWTFRRGMKAPECAGLIHSDFERGFIRAEVTAFADFQKYGNLQKAKEAGKMRSEGRDYAMQDGDIVFFRFNV